MRAGLHLTAAAMVVMVGAAAAQQGEALAPFVVNGDAIAAPLAGQVGDAGRGRAIVRDRAVGNCLICHAIPEPDERFMGDIAPPLHGTGSRLSPAQLRLRLVDQSRINPNTVMPPYYRIEGLVRVAPRYREQPALTAQQIEDVVAYLTTLKE